MGVRREEVRIQLGKAFLKKVRSRGGMGEVEEKTPLTIKKKNRTYRPSSKEGGPGEARLGYQRRVCSKRKSLIPGRATSEGFLKFSHQGYRKNSGGVAQGSEKATPGERVRMRSQEAF